MKDDSARAVALVTGAASGLGKQLACQLLALNYRVICVDYNQEALRALEAELRIADQSALFLRANIADREDVDNLMMQVQNSCGRINVLINNAGVIHAFSKIESVGRDSAERVFAVNFWGTVNMTLAGLPLLRQSGRPLLVNIVSIGAVVPTIGQGYYCASKAAVVHLSDTLALELKTEGIDVMLVFPGAMSTNIMENAPLTEGNEAHKKVVAAFRSGNMAQGVTTPETAARRIVASLGRRPRRLYVGVDARVMSVLHRLLPGMTGRLLAAVMKMASKKIPAMNEALK
jgi:short-subunit dehydrogenase